MDQKYSREYLLSELFKLREEDKRKITLPIHAVSEIIEYAYKDVEHFLVITLDGSNRVVRLHDISKGTVNKTLIHPRDVFRAALIDNACAIITAHNHPSGTLEASLEDKSINKKLKECSNLLDIPILDNIIISSRGYYSFSENETSSFPYALHNKDDIISKEEK